MLEPTGLARANRCDEGPPAHLHPDRSGAGKVQRGAEDGVGFLAPAVAKGAGRDPGNSGEKRIPARRTDPSTFREAARRGWSQTKSPFSAVYEIAAPEPLFAVAAQ